MLREGVACWACGKVEPLSALLKVKNKIINLITNKGVVNQINEPEWKDQPVINKWKLACRYLPACH